MQRCNLILDSCCDLPFEVIDKPGIELLRFPYIMSDGEHLDDLYQTTSAHDFYQAMRDGEEPTTAQVAVPVFQEAFGRAIESGVPTVYLSFTSGLSGSFDVACLVRDQLLAEHPEAELYLVDTLQASVAEGLLRVRGHPAARQGAHGARAGRMGQRGAFLRGRRVHGGGPGVAAPRRAHPRLGGLCRIKAGREAPAHHRDRWQAARCPAWRAGARRASSSWWSYYQRRVAKEGPGRCVVVAHADCQKDADRLKEMLARLDESILFLECDIGPVIEQPCGTRHDRGGVLGLRPPRRAVRGRPHRAQGEGDVGGLTAREGPPTPHRAAACCANRGRRDGGFDMNYLYSGNAGFLEGVAGRLAEAGFVRTDDVEDADAVVTFCASQTALEDAYFDERGFVQGGASRHRVGGPERLDAQFRAGAQRGRRGERPGLRWRLRLSWGT